MFKLVKKGNIEYFVSDLFPPELVHAFTTRRGGFAPPPLDNFSMGTAQYSDTYDFILNNRKLICSELNINYDDLLMTQQQHTDNIVILDSVKRSYPDKFLPDTDAVIITNKNIPAMLFFADCTPIMLYDTNKKILGLVHAGWKGTAKQILAKTLQKFFDIFNSSADDIIAAIGPSIGKCCYEVSSDVALELLGTIPPELVSDKIISYENTQPFVDLKQINVAQLQSYQVKTVDVIAECTSCHSDLFFSHRATQGQTGRQALIAQIS